MNWINRKICMPPDRERVLTFSPLYEEDHPMRFRITEGQFFRIMTDATHWATLEAPDKDV